MQLIHKQKIDADWKTINTLIKNGAFVKGDEIEIDGSLWRVLDTEEGGIFIWKHSGPGEDVVFNENGSNKYEGSNLQKYARENFPATVPEEMRRLVTEEGFFPLSLDEVKKYLPTEGERIATDENGDTVWWWLRSAYRGYATNTWFVGSSGAVSSYGAYNAYRFAPACHLKA